MLGDAQMVRARADRTRGNAATKENGTERGLTPRLMYMKQSCLHQPTVPEYIPHLLTHNSTHTQEQEGRLERIEGSFGCGASLVRTTLPPPPLLYSISSP